MYEDVTNALGKNVKPEDIGSIYHVYQDFTTLRTLANDYIGKEGDASSKGKAKKYTTFLHINETVKITNSLFYKFYLMKF